MDKTNKSSLVNEIAGKFLGSGKTEYVEKYSPELLVRFERKASLEESNVNIEDEYYGFDIWNMWEVSFLLNNGLPIHGVGKLVLPAESKWIVESKAMKLYFFGFAMEKMGDTIEEAISNFQTKVIADLNTQYEINIEFQFTQSFDVMKLSNNFEINDAFVNIFANCNIQNMVAYENIEITEYNESPDILKVIENAHFDDPMYEHMYKDVMKGTNPINASEPQVNMFAINTVKSNCRVTSQADFANGIIITKSKYTISSESLLKYITSFRNENHFHEECSHMIYDRIFKALRAVDPEAQVGVILLYTRRGGIDINPIRVSTPEMFNEFKFLKDIIDVNISWYKTSQQ